MTSRVGVGSTFGFAIPIRHAAAPGRDEAASTERHSVGSPSDSGTATILVVEDDRRSADLLTLHLERAGLTVAVARDGVEGLELARRLRPRQSSSISGSPNSMAGISWRCSRPMIQPRTFRS